MSWGRNLRGVKKVNGQFRTFKVVQGVGRNKWPNALDDEKKISKWKTLKTSKENNKHIDKYEAMTTIEKILVRMDT